MIEATSSRLFLCELCEAEFTGRGGGICSVCDRTLCRRHFPVLVFLGAKPPVCKACRRSGGVGRQSPDSLDSEYDPSSE
jgi:hypothetical protein